MSLHFFGLVLLLPLLLSLKARELYFVTFFRLVTIIWADGLFKMRRLALKPLDSLESRDPELKRRGALRVLEIGAGLGGNFEHVTRIIKYTNVDPNKEFGSAFLAELKKNPKIELERWIHSYAEDMAELPSGSFDVVMFSYLLCSAINGRKVLEETKRVLVKGGHLIFLEHVAWPRGTWQRLLQHVMTPLWSFFCCNCHLNRDSGELVAAAGFSHVAAQYSHVSMGIVLNYQVYGFAVA
ncbi:thiol S-methyltransferase TMT1B-like [Amblyomma americanum]